MIKFFTADVERNVIKMGLMMIISLVGLVELVIFESPQLVVFFLEVFLSVDLMVSF